MRVGKLTIAAELTQFENETALFEQPRVDQGTWYPWVWKQLDSRPDKLLENTLTIITFNYDRSLEYFFYQSLRHRHDLPGLEALQLTRALPIVHVHGQLGKLGDEEESSRPYEPCRDPHELDVAAAGISVISEAEQEDERFARARKALELADRVHFLGFGYDPRSVRRLGFSEGPAIRPYVIGGTTVGLTPAEIETASEGFGELRFVAGDPRHNVLDYLRHLPRFDR